MENCAVCGQPIPGRLTGNNGGPRGAQRLRPAPGHVLPLLGSPGGPGEEQGTPETPGESQLDAVLARAHRRLALALAEARRRLTPRPMPSTVVCPCCLGRGGHTEHYAPGHDNFDSWRCFCNQGYMDPGRTNPGRRCVPFEGD